MGVERRRLALALLLSMLFHALLLSLTFGGQGFGLPGFGFPWRERRIEAPDLRVMLVPAQVAAAEPAARSVKEPLRQALIDQPAAGGPALTSSVSLVPPPGRSSQATVPKARRKARVKPIEAVKQAAETKPTTAAKPEQTPRPLQLLRARLCLPKDRLTRWPHRYRSRQ
jgi:hypothetical protein